MPLLKKIRMICHNNIYSCMGLNWSMQSANKSLSTHTVAKDFSKSSSSTNWLIFSITVKFDIYRMTKPLTFYASGLFKSSFTSNPIWPTIKSLLFSREENEIVNLFLQGQKIVYGVPPRSIFFYRLCLLF